MKEKTKLRLEGLLAFSPIPVIGERAALKMCRENLQYSEPYRSDADLLEQHAKRMAKQVRGAAYTGWIGFGALAAAEYFDLL